MGAGRKMETILLQKKAPPQWNLNSNSNLRSARNLPKKDLAGVIFGCKHSTYKECIFKELFGLPGLHFQYVQNITQGMPVFLFNYSDRKLHGIFESISAGQWEINPYAWTSEDGEKTMFPAQVRVKIRVLCKALTEDQYQPILAGNYSKHEPNHFWFELDKSQTNKLISLFSAFPVTQKVSTSHHVSNLGKVFRHAFDAATSQNFSSRTITSERSSGTSAANDKGKQKLEVDVYGNAQEKRNTSTSCEEKSWSSLFKPQSDSIPNKKPEHSKKSALEMHVPCQNQFSMFWESSCSELSPDGENEPFEEWPTKEASYEDDDQVSSLIINPKFADLPGTEDEITSLTQNSDQIALAADMFNGEQDTKTVDSDDTFSLESNMDWASLLPNLDLDGQSELTTQAPLGETICEEGHVTSNQCSERSNISAMPLIVDLEDNCPAMIDEAQMEATRFSEEMISEMESSDLATVVTKLIQTIGDMKLFQLTQTRKIQNLEQELVESNKKIEELKYNSGTFGQPMSSLSTGHVKETQLERYFQVPNSSILLVGGFNGSSWLSDVDCYLPFKDAMRSLESMISVRSYASAVIHDDLLYALGGGYGTSWYDTVESYNLKSHQWVSCPPLNRKKGSLAGACLSEKIFAIGGGNATDCLSEVEMLDLNIGKWIFTRSMAQKRFAPAAAEMNGVIYVVGGYDGQEYLKSVERFDPREYGWTTLQSMNTRRGCHSLTALNEKLYAIGGYDGSQMSPTVEVFEPRVGSWTMSEPMNYARGYMGAVTLENTIVAIGGMHESEEILDTVEIYSEGRGWELTHLKSVGKRCFFSAVVV